MALARSVFKRLVTKLKDKMPNPFASAHPMPPGSLIVSTVQCGDQVAHTDSSTTPHVPPPSERSKSEYHVSIFMALSPKYRLGIEVGTALGEASSFSTKGRAQGVP